jgi:hypothetical protein
MGADPELILLTTSAVASVPAALGALRAWLRVRRSTVHVKLTRDAGVVEVNAERVSPDRIFELVAEATKNLEAPKTHPDGSGTLEAKIGDVAETLRHASGRLRDILEETSALEADAAQLIKRAEEAQATTCCTRAGSTASASSPRTATSPASPRESASPA